MIDKLAVFKEISQKKAFAHIGTINPDGSPHVTPVWIDSDEKSGLILFNTSRSRRKERNMRKDPKIAISIQDPENPYHFAGIRGEVVEITEKGAKDHIDKLAKKYPNLKEYPWLQPGEVRVIVKVRPIAGWG